MAAPTHATIATFRMDLSQESAQREGLSRMIVPSVTSAPGFVAGTWTLNREQRESVVMITFDSADAAKAFVENVTANANHQAMVGIDLLEIQVVEVSASA